MREVGPGRLEVVVVAVHTHLGELVDLLLGQHAEGGRDVDVDRGLDGGDALAQLGHQPVVGAAHGGHDAELRGTGRGGLLGCLDQRGMSSQAARTGEANKPDCEQK